jgi:hypothetical protein
MNETNNQTNSPEDLSMVSQILSRRTAILAGIGTAGVLAATLPIETANAQQDGATEETDKDQAAVREAGMTEDEAKCWKLIAEAAGVFFKLPELHPMDRSEVATAIHIVQNKLLARPTYRKYVEIRKSQS